MIIDLREIIDVPGSKKNFQFQPDVSNIADGVTASDTKTPLVVGVVTNSNGVLSLSATLNTVLICACARCLNEFEQNIELEISANLNKGIAGEDPDGYDIIQDTIDTGEIVYTEMQLQIDRRYLCSDDCRGLCQKCGADLNTQACECKREIDPRLAVLSSLIIEEDPEQEE